MEDAGSIEEGVSARAGSTHVTQPKNASTLLCSEDSLTIRGSSPGTATEPKSSTDDDERRAFLEELYADLPKYGSIGLFAPGARGREARDMLGFRQEEDGTPPPRERSDGYLNVQNTMTPLQPILPREHRRGEGAASGGGCRESGGGSTAVLQREAADRDVLASEGLPRRAPTHATAPEPGPALIEHPLARFSLSEGPPAPRNAPGDPTATAFPRPSKGRGGSGERGKLRRGSSSGDGELQGGGSAGEGGYGCGGFSMRAKYREYTTKCKTRSLRAFSSVNSSSPVPLALAPHRGDEEEEERSSLDGPLEDRRWRKAQSCASGASCDAAVTAAFKGPFETDLTPVHEERRGGGGGGGGSSDDEPVVDFGVFLGPGDVCVAPIHEPIFPMKERAKEGVTEGGGAIEKRAHPSPILSNLNIDTKEGGREALGVKDKVVGLDVPLICGLRVKAAPGTSTLNHNTKS